MSKHNFVMTIAWDRNPDNEDYLNAQVTRNGVERQYAGVSQSSIERLSRCVDGLRPRVWGGGSYWGGVYNIEAGRGE